MFKKILFFLFIIFFFLFFVFMGAALIYSQEKNISLWQELKTDSRNIILQIMGVIYSGAEKHNPQGDIFPDSLDDRIIEKIKIII